MNSWESDVENIRPGMHIQALILPQITSVYPVLAIYFFLVIFLIRINIAFQKTFSPFVLKSILMLFLYFC